MQHNPPSQRLFKEVPVQAIDYHHPPHNSADKHLVFRNQGTPAYSSARRVSLDTPNFLSERQLPHVTLNTKSTEGWGVALTSVAAAGTCILA
jgi:hypothetical protein